MATKNSSKPLLIDEKFVKKVQKKKTEINNNNLKYDTGNCIYYFIRYNIGIIILLFLLLLLLYQRYLYVQLRKEEEKNIYNQKYN